MKRPKTPPKAVSKSSKLVVLKHQLKELQLAILNNTEVVFWKNTIDLEVVTLKYTILGVNRLVNYSENTESVFLKNTFGLEAVTLELAIKIDPALTLNKLMNYIESTELVFWTNTLSLEAVTLKHATHTKAPLDLDLYRLENSIERFRILGRTASKETSYKRHYLKSLNNKEMRSLDWEREIERKGKEHHILSLGRLPLVLSLGSARSQPRAEGKSNHRSNN